jgi:hypothetical protein
MIFKIFLLGCLILGLQLCACHEANLAEEKSLNAEESSSIAESSNDEMAILEDKLQQSIEIKNWYAQGYNVARATGLRLKSNSKFIDAGLLNEIFDTSRKSSSSPNKIPTPLGFEVMELKGCTNAFSSKTINTVSGLKEEFSTGIGISAEYMGISFSANTDYEKLESSLKDETKTIVSNEAKCGKYRVLVNFYDPPRLHTNFIDALMSINNLNFNEQNIKDPNNKKFWDFIDITVGTHYIRELVLGSSYSFIQELSNDTIKEMKKSGLDVSASLSYLSFANVGISLKTNNESKVDQFKNKVTTSVFIAGITTKSNKFEDFLSGNENSIPEMISMKLKPIMDLLKNKYFKDRAISQNATLKYDAIVENLAKAYNKYCEYLGKSCSQEKANPGRNPSTKTTHHKTGVTEIQEIYFLDRLHVKCPEGSAISRVKAENGGDKNFYYNYECLESTGITSECYDRQTKANDFGGDGKKALIYLDRHFMECDEDQLMTEFKLNHINNAKKSINYSYKCCNAKTINCEDFRVVGINNINRSGNFDQLTLIDVATTNGNKKFGIQSLGMETPNTALHYRGKKCQVEPSSEL